jgi:putative NIF3 family GTP cyclohydrolase 1 type 2
MRTCSRREFIGAGATIVGAAGMASAATASTPAAASGQPAGQAGQAPARTGASPLRARDVRDHLLGLNGGWLNAEKTVDTFKCGDPESVVRGIAVGWMPYTWALRRAIDAGCNLFVTHEPIFYDHLDQNQDVFRFEGARAKRALVDRSGLVVYRCHDIWDQYPGVGIVDAWAETLGFSKPVAGSGYFRVFDGAGRTALDVARQVAGRTKRYGQDHVHLVGPAGRRVHRVAIGCGAITPFQRFVAELQADMAICCDDNFVHWRDGALAVDLEVPVVVVNHTVSEARGIELLAEHLRHTFSPVKVLHIPEACMFSVVSA